MKKDNNAPLAVDLEIEGYKVSYFPLEIEVRGMNNRENNETLKSIHKYCIQRQHYKDFRNLILKTMVLASNFIFIFRDQSKWTQE